MEKSQCFIGKPSINGPFSRAMLNNQRVTSNLIQSCLLHYGICVCPIVDRWKFLRVLCVVPFFLPQSTAPPPGGFLSSFKRRAAMSPRARAAFSKGVSLGAALGNHQVSREKRGKKRGTWEIPNFYGEIGLAISVGKSWEIPRLGHKNGTILYKWGTNIFGPNKIGGIYGFCFGWLRAYKWLASIQRSRDKLFSPH